MGGGSLADKVANNSRKITLIKNVISTGKSDLGSQLASLDGGYSSPESDLTEINEALNDIGNALALDFANRIVEKKENLRKAKRLQRMASAKAKRLNVKGKSTSLTPPPKPTAQPPSRLAVALGSSGSLSLRGSVSASEPGKKSPLRKLGRIWA